MDVLIVDLGLALLLVGGACLVKPLRGLRISTRRRAALVLAFGLGFLALGVLLPVSPPRFDGPRMLLHEVVPDFEFGEHHEIRITAPRDRVYAAVRSVTAGAPARRRFAAYWRAIYPGSAFIRRMWLDAIRRRAEDVAP